jgi:hypothetical protein
MPKPRQFSRREFSTTSLLGLLGLGAASAPVLKAAATATQPSATAARGVWKIIRNPKLLESPRGMPEGEIWRYLLNCPFQLGPGMAGLYCNLKQSCGPGQDFEGGVDIIPFGRREDVTPERAQPVSRQHVEPNPNFGGKPSIMAK